MARTESTETRDTQLRLLSAAEFKAAARKGEDLASAGCWKASAGATKAVNPDGTIDFVISGESPDRDGDVISLDGWDLSNFEKNPVVLFAHDHDALPVAKSLRVWREMGSLVSRVEFTPRDLNPLGDTLRRMYAAKFMNAQSVGFRPMEFESRDTDDGMGGFLFKRQEMLEHSCVPVPAFPDALMRAHAAKIDTTPLRDWCSQLLDGESPMPKGLASEDLEKAWRARTADPFFVEIKRPDQPEPQEDAPVSDAAEPQTETQPEKTVAVDPKQLPVDTWKSLLDALADEDTASVHITKSGDETKIELRRANRAIPKSVVDRIREAVKELTEALDAATEDTPHDAGPEEIDPEPADAAPAYDGESDLDWLEEADPEELRAAWALLTGDTGGDATGATDGTAS